MIAALLALVNCPTWTVGSPPRRVPRTYCPQVVVPPNRASGRFWSVLVSRAYKWCRGRQTYQRVFHIPSGDRWEHVGRCSALLRGRRGLGALAKVSCRLLEHREMQLLACHRLLRSISRSDCSIENRIFRNKSISLFELKFLLTIHRIFTYCATRMQSFRSELRK